MELKLKELKEAIARARYDAVRTAKKGAPYIKSRGTWLCTVDKDGQCRPSPEAECQAWDGTLREIHKLVAIVQAAYPNVEVVYVAGGYDGYEEFRDIVECADYTPWVSQWEVDVWKKGVGYIIDGGST